MIAYVGPVLGWWHEGRLAMEWLEWSYVWSQARSWFGGYVVGLYGVCGFGCLWDVYGFVRPACCSVCCPLFFCGTKESLECPDGGVGTGVEHWWDWFY